MRLGLDTYLSDGAAGGLGKAFAKSPKSELAFDVGLPLPNKSSPRSSIKLAEGLLDGASMIGAGPSTCKMIPVFSFSSRNPNYCKLKNEKYNEHMKAQFTFPKLAEAPRSTFREGVEGFLAGLEPFCFLMAGGIEAAALRPGLAQVLFVSSLELSV